MLKITNDDLRAIINIRNGNQNFIEDITYTHQKNFFDMYGWDINNFYLALGDPLKDKILTQRIENYFIKKYNFDIADCIEYKLMNASKDLKQELKYYKDRIASGYVSQIPDNIAKIISYQMSGSNDKKNDLIQLILLDNDKYNAAKNLNLFAATTKFKALEISKLQKLWNKNFKGISVENYPYIMKLFDVINKDKKIFSKKDHLLMIYQVDYVSLTLINKLSENLNSTIVSQFFNALGTQWDDTLKNTTYIENITFVKDSIYVIYNDQKMKTNVEKCIEILLEAAIDKRTILNKKIHNYDKSFIDIVTSQLTSSLLQDNLPHKEKINKIKI